MHILTLDLRTGALLPKEVVVALLEGDVSKWQGRGQIRRILDQDIRRVQNASTNLLGSKPIGTRAEQT